MKNFEMTIGRNYGACYDLKYYVRLEKDGEEVWYGRGCDWRYMVKKMRRELGLEHKHIETYNLI